ncbi:MAG: membrane-bound lytic murein transglycosylase MltF, partial [Burkholderiales bacterium]|nr:membrane-bound lytic murein transglycosylase MltF [Burkholderiales bacterium]
ARMRRLFPFIRSAFIFGLCLAAVWVLYQEGNLERPLSSAQQSGEIVVLTVNSPTTYFEDAIGEMTGPEHDLATRFANELGLKLRFEVVRSEAELIDGLVARRGHLAAGTLSPTREREKLVRFGPAYQTITQKIIYRSDQPRLRSVKDLAGKSIGVLARSHHAEKLAELRPQIHNLRWQEFDESTDELLRRVSDGERDAVVVDSNWLALSGHLYPDIEIGFDLAKPVALAWAFPLAGDDFIYNAAKKFFARIQEDGSLKRLISRYYDDRRHPSKIDVATFLQRSQTLLPRYRRLFQEAQEITGIDWRLLAAVGYQESHWDPLATSPTGVRGLMMLTEETADRLKVKNRLDARESVLAGARYLLLLKDSIPERIAEPDRTWLALAAYNQGLGHLEDARVLAQRLKRSADLWTDVRAAMPLLSDPDHHSTLKHGYARGGEAVVMTENIRTYYDILARMEKPYRPLFEQLNTDLLNADSGEPKIGKMVSNSRGKN